MNDGFINAFNDKIEQLNNANQELTRKVTEGNTFNQNVLSELDKINTLVESVGNKIKNLKKRINVLTNAADENSTQLDDARNHENNIFRI